MKKHLSITLWLLLFLNIGCLNALNKQNVRGVSGAGFGIVTQNSVADVLVDANDSKTVLLSAKLFSEDVQRVTGRKPHVQSSVKAASPVCVIVGTIEGSSLIKKLIKDDKIDVSQVRGRWESHLRQVVNEPFDGVEKALVIAGSDRRGAAYGLLDISKRMGVSPWYYFADVPVKKSNTICIDSARFVQKSPSVKYRGILLLMKAAVSARQPTRSYSR